MASWSTTGLMGRKSTFWPYVLLSCSGPGGSPGGPERQAEDGTAVDAPGVRRLSGPFWVGCCMKGLDGFLERD